MPLYEYKCENCQQVTEALQKFSDPPLTTCPHCEGSLRKLFSSPAIQFKGSGFYITDYGKSGSSAASAAGSTKTETVKTDSSSSDSSKASGSGS